MSDELDLIKKRFKELYSKADRGAYFTFTDFLGLAEQSVLSSVSRQLHTKLMTYGGTDGAERIVARFGDPEIIGYDGGYPIKIIRITPKDSRFAEKLTHRDYLGALVNLGIERDVMGDIVLCENEVYLFALEDIADYIVRSLDKVRNTNVRPEIVDTTPDGPLYKTEAQRITVESIRIDAILARICKLSREGAQALVKRKLVYVDGRLIDSVSYRPKDGEVISVRGFGRMIYQGSLGQTKRGRIALSVEIYK